MNWRDFMTDNEKRDVAYCEQARLDLSKDIGIIRDRCKKRMQRSNRNGPCKQDENNAASD